MAHRYHSPIAIIFSIITIIYTIILQQYDSDEEMPWDFRQV